MLLKNNDSDDSDEFFDGGNDSLIRQTRKAEPPATIPLQPPNAKSERGHLAQRTDKSYDPQFLKHRMEVMGNGMYFVSVSVCVCVCVFVSFCEVFCFFIKFMCLHVNSRHSKKRFFDGFLLL